MMASPGIGSVSAQCSTDGALDDQKKCTIESKVDETARKELCEFCFNAASKVCQKCLVVVYCNSTCQRNEWATHKVICTKIQSAVEHAGTIGKRDELGLTVPHYLALYGKEASIPKERETKSMAAKDSCNATPAELLELLAPPVEGEISLQFRTPEGELRKLSQEEFLRMTGVRFKNGLFARRRIFLQTRTNAQKPLLAMDAENSHVKNFEKKAPQIYLAQEPGMGLGLVAGQDFEEDAIICFTGGEIVETPNKSYRNKRDRVFAGVDHDKVTGPGTFINDGPPNCEFKLISNFRGLHQVGVVQAIRKIKMGEFFHVTYGTNHSLRGGKHVLSPESYQEIVNFSRMQPKNTESFSQHRYYASMFFYILSLPNVISLLIIRGIMDAKKTATTLEKFKRLPFFNDNKPAFYPYYEQLFAFSDWIRESNDQALIRAAEGFVNDLSEETLIKMILLIGENQGNRSIEFVTHCTHLGKIYDHLHLHLHGTLFGTYVGTNDFPEKMPVFLLDQKMIEVTFSQLPATHQSALITQVGVYVKFALENNLSKPELFGLFVKLSCQGKQDR